jgi:hypothetical protein
MERPGTKEAAEAILRDLPSVVGAFVREDPQGRPREVHILIAPGTQPRHFARDVRDLLEERLGVPIDQRIISIAQLARTSGPEGPEEAGVPAAARPVRDGRPRLRFDGCRSQVTGGRVRVAVELADGATRFTGEADEVEAGEGRLRAGAVAALRAATAACAGNAHLALESATVVHALGRRYVLVSATVASARFGRRPVQLAGAQELDDEPETCAALAALKSANRVLGLVLGLDAGAAATPRRPRRR